MLSLGPETLNRPKHRSQLRGRARRQIHSQHTRIIVTERQTVAPFIAHDQEFSEMTPQLLERGVASEKDSPTVAPGSLNELVSVPVAVVELHQIRRRDL